ncbi:ABC transporter permease subunit [Klugiella xanthotipulae]|uniref:Peptide/nickel transport system permease protein n=1 Tax=Klugiella xanthotipulae TaxID=244735 RepID=A0A543HY47_9MICO|nr:ABC transporter permease [Klugiella xanthotipulae]TQM63277.1 peptide/nickel transport system permease protein [Klugiella xanthotipulae]
MSRPSAAPMERAPFIAPRHRSWVIRLLRHPTGAVSLGVIAIVCLAAAVSFVWTPYNPSSADAYARWLAPSGAHLLGTDAVGRDTLSRLMLGARVTVVVATVATALAAVCGTVLAVVGTFSYRVVREPIAVLIDVLIAFPTLLIAMMLAASFGGSTAVVIVAVGISNGVNIARVLRPEIRQVAGSDFVRAARACGVSKPGILWRHILPGVTPVFIVQLSLTAALSILAEAGLSFLGFGAPSASSSWGRMLAETQKYVTAYPLAVVWPGLAVTITVLAFHLLGDALREVTDPQLTRYDGTNRAMRQLRTLVGPR